MDTYVKELRKRTRETGHEFIFAIGLATGKQKTCWSEGDNKTCHLSRPLTKEKLRIVHSHPCQDLTFSAKDVNLLLDSQVLEIEVVCFQSRYLLTRPDSFMAGLYDDFAINSALDIKETKSDSIRANKTRIRAINLLCEKFGWTFSKLEG